MVLPMGYCIIVECYQSNVHISCLFSRIHRSTMVKCRQVSSVVAVASPHVAMFASCIIVECCLSEGYSYLMSFFSCIQQKLDIAGKKVAVFGLGDSVSYAENYADATGELHDVFESLGCKMMGYTSAEGYKHEASKAIRGDLFCGLALDAVNEEELTEDRVKNWVAALLDAGITSTDEAAPAAAAPVASPSPQVEEAAPVVFDDHVLAEEIIAEVKNTRSGYVAHYNRSGKTKTKDEAKLCKASDLLTRIQCSKARKYLQ